MYCTLWALLFSFTGYTAIARDRNVPCSMDAPLTRRAGPRRVMLPSAALRSPSQRVECSYSAAAGHCLRPTIGPFLLPLHEP